MYTTYVVYLVSGIWESMVCGVEVGGMWSRSGRLHTFCLRSFRRGWA